jgi:hypothetical protein
MQCRCFCITTQAASRHSIHHNSCHPLRCSCYPGQSAFTHHFLLFAGLVNIRSAYRRYFCIMTQAASRYSPHRPHIRASSYSGPGLSHSYHYLPMLALRRASVFSYQCPDAAACKTFKSKRSKVNPLPGTPASQTQTKPVKKRAGPLAMSCLNNPRRLPTRLRGTASPAPTGHQSRCPFGAWCPPFSTRPRRGQCPR